MTEKILISDLTDIWIKRNDKELEKIEKEIAPKSLSKIYIFDKLRKYARIGKMSSFFIGMEIYRKSGYENYIELRKKFMDIELKRVRKVYLISSEAIKVLKKLSKKLK